MIHILNQEYTLSPRLISGGHVIGPCRGHYYLPHFKDIFILSKNIALCDCDHDDGRTENTTFGQYEIPEGLGPRQMYDFFKQSSKVCFTKSQIRLIKKKQKELFVADGARHVFFYRNHLDVLHIAMVYCITTPMPEYSENWVFDIIPVHNFCFFPEHQYEHILFVAEKENIE